MGRGRLWVRAHWTCPTGWPSAQMWLLCAVHSHVAWLQPFSPTARFPEAEDSPRVSDTLPGHGVSLAQGSGGLRSGDVWHLPCWRAECGCWRAGMWPRGAVCEGLRVGLDTAGGRCLPRLWRACRWLGCGRGPLGQRPACSTPLSLPALHSLGPGARPREHCGGTVGRTAGRVPDSLMPTSWSAPHRWTPYTRRAVCLHASPPVTQSVDGIVWRLR